MSARIIGVVNQKGGSGKTTTSMSLAGALAERGLRTLVVDADPQGTASQWSAAASDDKPFPATVVSLAAAGGKIAREIRPHVDNYDRIIVDCPPALDSLVPASVLVIADLALVPVTLSPADLWATRGVRALVENAQAMNEGLRAFLLPNRVQRTIISGQVLEVLADVGLPVLNARLGQRAAFMEACLNGTTLAGQGSAGATAAQEVEALAGEVEQLLKERK
ncbi:MAG: AAA family ATPase [Nitrososphaerota archaeon]|nr:AAA family ATPase [Nitrososphaerota archaeon]